MGKKLFTARRAVLGAVLLLLAALAVFTGLYVARHWQSGESAEVYTSVEDAKIPRIRFEMYGRRMNLLAGHTENEENAIGREDLTILPEDRRLTIDIDPDGCTISGLRYEIRNLAGDHLVERTEVTEFGGDGDEVTAVLPVQNLIRTDQEYAMMIVLTVDDGREIYYYTRLLQPSGQSAQGMVDLSAEFSDKTFDETAARDLTTYLEVSDSADNSSLADIDLTNNFDMLTWHDTGMRKDGETEIHLRELQGGMCTVELDYTAARDEDSRTIYYDVRESFTMRQGEQRVYMMDFNRKVRQVFDGDTSMISGGQITLGVNDGGDVTATQSETGGAMTFSTDGDLWVYVKKSDNLTRIYSTRDDETTRGEDHRSCLVKTLTVTDAGDVNFFVSGYQSRGNHAGMTGTTLYHYNSDSNSLSELLYLPSNEPVELLMEDADTLGYLTPSGKFCILMNGTVYGLTTDSADAEVLADGLSRDTFAASASGSRIAWQDGGQFDSTSIHILSLDDGTDNVITAGDGERLRLAGFVGEDVVYGIGRDSDAITAENRVTSLPLYSVRIVDPDMQTEVTYEKENVYVTDITISDSRIHMSRVSLTESGFQPIEEDTLISNESVENLSANLISTATDRVVGEVAVIQADGIGSSVHVRTPGKAQARENDEIQVDEQDLPSLYLTYSRGEFTGSYSSLPSAVDRVYDRMGTVTDTAGHVIYSRVDRPASADTGDTAAAVSLAGSYLQEFKDGKTVSDDGTLLLDGRGMSLSEVLYYVGRGLPAVICFSDGSYGVITGYDQFGNITYVRNAESGNLQTEMIGPGDAGYYFDQNGDDFICFLRIEDD